MGPGLEPPDRAKDTVVAPPRGESFGKKGLLDACQAAEQGLLATWCLVVDQTPAIVRWSPEDL